VFGRKILSLALCLLAGTAPLSGQRRTSWNLIVDNDLFALWRSPEDRTDRDYSSGVELSMARPLSGDQWTRTLAFSLDHQIFTPNIEAPRPVPEDRPFAAILTGGVNLIWERPKQRHQLGARLSVTGPPALGKELQQVVHTIIAAPAPTGWEHQLPFAIGVTVAYAGDRPLLEVGGVNGIGFRTAARWAAEAGTIRSAASVGLGANLGWRPSQVWRSLVPDPPERRGVRVFLPLGVGLDVVGQSFAVDGGFIAKVTGLDRRTLVPHAEVGLGVEFGGLALSWTGHVTGRDFETQPTAHRYGTFSLSVR
jgi:hypothetical protein